MEADKRMETVKQDLRRLRRVARDIEVALQVKERHEKRLAYLLMQEQNAQIVQEIETIQKNLASLCIEAHIKQANELEATYMEAIGHLEPLDRTILLDAYINGKAYWKVGQDVGYTEISVRKRVKKAIAFLADYLFS